MSHRQNVSVYRQKDFKSPPSPNATVDAISVDIRVFFPPNAKPEDILPLYDETVALVRQRLGGTTEPARKVAPDWRCGNCGATWDECSGRTIWSECCTSCANSDRRSHGR
jgi:hypothetical protein